MSSGPSIALIGAGKMGQAMLQGFAAQGSLGPVVVVEPNPAPALRELCAAKGYRLVSTPDVTMSPPDALLLAVKPQMLDAAAPALAPLAGKDTLLISVLAGKRAQDLAARFPDIRAIVRAMPNTPAAIGRGMTGAFANAAATPEQRALAHRLLSTVGAVEWLDDEPSIDALTAVSGSGPAYVFYLTECLAAAGVAAGLSADLSMRLARATVAGAGELMARNPDIAPATLRQNVTSPGGTTAAALDVLMAPDALGPLLDKAVAAAKRRAGELSG